MSRNQQQIGHLAFQIYEALKLQKFTVEELTKFGEALYAGASIDKVPNSAKIKLFKAAEGLDKVFPLPTPVAMPAPGPAALVVAPPAPPPAPAPVQAAPQPTSPPVANGTTHHQEAPAVEPGPEAPPSTEPARG